MPTEENQNVQTGQNPIAGDQSSLNNEPNNVEKTAFEKNLDIDLNLDGVDIPSEPQIVKKEEIKIEQPSVPVVESVVEEKVETVEDKGDDRLAEEDKKVEALQGKQSETVPSEKIETAEDIMLKEDPVNEVENLLEAPTEEPKVEMKQEEFAPTLAETTELEQLEELDSIADDIAPVVENVKVDETKIEEPQTNINEENKNVDNDINLNNSGLKTEDLGEIVVENKAGDIVSDTGDVTSNSNAYMPNEHDFGTMSDVLENTDKGGAVDLGSLETNKDESKNLEVGFNDVVNLNTNDVAAQSGMNLDSMIADLGNTEGLKAEVKKEEVPATQIDLGAIDTQVSVPENKVENNQNNVAVNVESMQTPVNVAQVLPVINQPVNEVVQPIQQATTVVQNMGEMPNTLNKKSSHKGLKIFLLIVLLLVGGVFVLSKMYPQEVTDMMNAIKGNDTTVIEYSDNAKMDAVLEETQDDVVDSAEPIEEPDPNSLAAQLEGDNNTGAVDNAMDYATGTDVLKGTGDDLNMVDEDFNAFEGLEEVMDPVTSANAELLEKMRSYETKGVEYDAWGRDVGNTTAMKYGLYISEKAQGVINDIENGVKIDNTKVDNYFAQFDIYIQKLDNLRSNADGESTANAEEEAQGDSLVSSGSNEPTNTNTGAVQY